MTQRVVTTAFNSIFDQDLEVNAGIDAAFSLGRSGRACTNCVRAKAKCSPGVNVGGKCERCHRMKKDCQPSPPVRKRRRVKRHSANKVEKLEEKLDGLVTLLMSATQGAPGIFHATSVNSALDDLVPSSHGNTSGSAAAGSIGYRDYTFNRPLPTGRGLPNSAFTPAASSSSGSASINLKPLLHPALEPSPEDVESYLNKFRTDFVKHLPFIVISLSVAAHQLRQESPILWLCIMAVASSRSTEQIVLSKEVREIFGREAYVEGTRNMDLLLAVLLYTTCLVQLAIAILYDLGLDKPPSKDPGVILAYDMKGARKPSRFSRFPTLEERRALLGCFLISSVYVHLHLQLFRANICRSCFSRKGETLRWTAYFDECLRVLEEQKEFASDAVLSLQAQLHDFKFNIPSELTNNKTLLLELYNTEFSIHGICFSQAPDIFIGQYNQRFECLCACLQATKSWVDMFLSILPAQYVGFSALMYAKMTRCFIGLYRLSTCEHPEWDRGLVRETLDAEKKFAQVKEAAGLDLGDSENLDFVSIMASKLRSIKMSWDAMPISTTASFSTAALDELGDFPRSF
ncbi:hypothetical protein V1508DRAFT_406919 [Lipomyces doorenjongii]|uniref:uncharacterized protein n=1 Tax=Lipomyces doorenjongii TaxID=383834 RepID=UPI0034CD0EB9